MRLLILAQVVDLDDPVLGFFHRWVVELAKHCETVHVICLKQGRIDLPANVTVHSLGKEAGPSRLKYISRFFSYIWHLRGEYDAVFVHMNSVYVALGGLLWRLMRKRIYMWYNHYARSGTADIAAFFCTKMFSTSRKAYVVRYKKTILMPIGIDTIAFAPGSEPPIPRSILILGRIDSPKRVDVFIKALAILHADGVAFTADIVGNPSDPSSAYMQNVRELAAPLVLDGVLTLHAGITNDAARAFFRSHEVYCNISPQGMFDKTIGEAMASGCVTVTNNEALRGVLPPELAPSEVTAETVASSLKAALVMTPEDRCPLIDRSRTWVEREHSLDLLARRLIEAMGG